MDLSSFRPPTSRFRSPLASRLCSLFASRTHEGRTPLSAPAPYTTFSKAGIDGILSEERLCRHRSHGIHGRPHSQRVGNPTRHCTPANGVRQTSRSRSPAAGAGAGAQHPPSGTKPAKRRRPYRVDWRTRLWAVRARGGYHREPADAPRCDGSRVSQVWGPGRGGSSQFYYQDERHTAPTVGYPQSHKVTQAATAEAAN